VLFGWKHLKQEELERIARGIVENRIYGGPWHLELQPTNHCNLDCVFCCTKPQRHGQVLPWEKLEGVLREAAARNLRFLRLSGGGEGLLYPAIRPLLDLCGELGIRIVDLTTNATLLEPFARELIEIGVDYVLLSFNECDPRRYAETMRTTERMFHQGVRGIEALCAARDAGPTENRPKIDLQLVVWRSNWRHLHAMYEFGLTLPVDRILLKSLMLLPDAERIPPEDIPTIKGLLVELIEEDCRSGRYKLAFDLSKESDLNHFAYTEQVKRLPPGMKLGPDFVKTNPREEYCYMGWYSATVTAEGDVHPCCVMSGMRGREFGNILREPLDSIWRGAGFRRFRNEIRNLMLLDGNLEFSRRFTHYLEPPCIDCFGCQWGFLLCSPEFYREVATRMRQETSWAERGLARTKNTLIKTLRRARRAVRRTYS